MSGIYGPNTADVERALERLRRASAEEATAADGAWNRLWDSEDLPWLQEADRVVDLAFEAASNDYLTAQDRLIDVWQDGGIRRGVSWAMAWDIVIATAAFGHQGVEQWHVDVHMLPWQAAVENSPHARAAIELITAGIHPRDAFAALAAAAL